MKIKKLLVFLLTWVFFQTVFAQKNVDFATLEKLYDDDRCFELSEAVENFGDTEDSRILFFRGAVAYYFFKTDLSNKYLTRFIKKTLTGNDALQRKAYGLLASNFLRLGEYGKAADNFSVILNRFKSQLDANEIANYENIIQLTTSLKKVKPQKVKIKADSLIKKSESSNEWTLPVAANNFSVNLIVDTGANFSLIAKSLAEKLGIKYVNADINIGTINTTKVQPQLGVLPEMRIGNVVVNNAVFLVMDDKSLTFPDGFMLKGVVGLPVFAALREITFKNNGDFFIPAKPRRTTGEKMCLDGLDILFRASYREQKYTFQLDSGANHSVLYPLFFKQFEDEIKSKYEKVTEKITGVGGSQEVSAYLMKNIELKLGNKTGKIEKLKIIPQKINEKSEKIYGNIGQDFIRGFKSFTLNFNSMTISVE